MRAFFQNLPPEAAQRIEGLARLSHELRDARDAILNRYGVADAEALLAAIASAALPEHPAYDHYLSLRILAATREAVREELAQALREATPE